MDEEERTPEEEIEFLNDQISMLKGAIEGWRKRVEELESYPICAPYCIVITDEQIDAAWTEAWNTYYLWKGAAFSALSKIGIVRCKECGGDGKTQETIDHNMYGEPVHIFSSCKGCNGHGWVVKDE